ncbi:uncharacterized protein LOC111285537 [Durio zibethinus]|uniref:Uncharacterized protein LOC111285537 n=1 Tax=Durio zibethinus TaxID=66656 RepID=A0A6P5XRB8_DURZI|nr:uncharacterized protein LOC111285537 [Durio zibethinus]
MDYSLEALKLLCGQLKDALEIPSQNALILGGVLLQRAWLQVFFFYSFLFPFFNQISYFTFLSFFLQGVLVSNDDDDSLLLDDSTGIVELGLSGDSRQRQWKKAFDLPPPRPHSFSTAHFNFIHPTPFLYGQPCMKRQWLKAFLLF